MSGIAELYSWLAKNNIDIEYNKDSSITLQDVCMQIQGGYIDITPELLSILDKIQQGSQKK